MYYLYECPQGCDFLLIERNADTLTLLARTLRAGLLAGLLTPFDRFETAYRILDSKYKLTI